ncbi:hypothetical protein MA05_09955 [Comamonas aquatica]|nr:hypothetical protein MA05_09955 [Comamonas aquatica]
MIYATAPIAAITDLRALCQGWKHHFAIVSNQLSNRPISTRLGLALLSRRITPLLDLYPFFGSQFSGGRKRDIGVAPQRELHLATF